MGACVNATCTALYLQYTFGHHTSIVCQHIFPIPSSNLGESGLCLVAQLFHSLCCLLVFDLTNPKGYFDHHLAPTHIRYHSLDDEGDPKDLSDVETGHENPGQNAIITPRDTPNLMLDERTAYLRRHICNKLRLYV